MLLCTFNSLWSYSQMGFKKNNKLGCANKKLVTEAQLAQINDYLQNKWGFNHIAKKVGISSTKLYSLGYKPTNATNQLKHIAKNSLVNPNLETIEAFCDLSDITTKSLFDANKHPRLLYFGDYTIKLAILATKNSAIIQLYKTKTRGELKVYWQNILQYAIGKYNLVAVDTNCKFTDSPIKLVHLVKDSKHPYNNIVEGKIGNLKSKIYANIDKIKLMEIDTAMQYIQQLALELWGDKVTTYIQQKPIDKTNKQLAPIITA